MKKNRDKMGDELRPEYDMSQLLEGAVRGKYAKRCHAGANLVLLDPDVRKATPLVIELRKIRSGRARVT
jgi:hypothetical protein